MAKKDQLTRNFHISEFACKDGTPVPEKYYQNALNLAVNLQALRDWIGEPVNITGSGYRTESHNRSVGGAKRSQHLTCSGADISVRNYSPRKLARTINKLIKLGLMTEGGIGLYNGFVHYDIRGTKARWDNSRLFNW